MLGVLRLLFEGPWSRGPGSRDLDTLSAQKGPLPLLSGQ
jgi:hypothetical protein